MFIETGEGSDAFCFKYVETHFRPLALCHDGSEHGVVSTRTLAHSATDPY